VFSALLTTRLMLSQGALTSLEQVTTLHVRAQIVSLDVTAVDKKGRSISSNLGREDFTISEDGQPQQILYFEPSSSHREPAATVFVLDQFNTTFEDAAYNRSSLLRYFKGLPETLPTPVQLMVLDIRSFQLVQSFTQSRAELISALIHLPASDVNSHNIGPDERLSKSLSALEGLALQNLGGLARRNVVWLGQGDGVNTANQTVTMRARTERFIRYMTNTLVEGRITLYVIDPPTEAATPLPLLATQSEQTRDISLADPYSGNINFRSIAAETGGVVFSGTNDLTGAMAKALDVGNTYYTLTYRPENTARDSRFRRISVTLRNPALHIITKDGYYAPEQEQEAAPQTNQLFQMTEAGKSTLPFNNLEFRVTHILRSPDRKTTEFTLFAEGTSLPWRPEGKEGSLAELTVGGLSLTRRGDMLASHFRNVNMMTHSQEPTDLQNTTASFKLLLHTPSNTDRVRLVLRGLTGGRIGALDVARDAILAAPESASPLPVEPAVYTPPLPNLDTHPPTGEAAPE
jgi:VWFA-related protein